MENENSLRIGRLLPDDSSIIYPHIDYETENYSNYSAENEIYVIMLTDQSKSIKISKEQIKVEIKNIESFPQFVLSNFKLLYSE